MKFLITNEIRKERKEIIETLLQDGYSPPGEVSEKGSAIAAAANILKCDPKTIRDWLDRESASALNGFESYLPDWGIELNDKPEVEYQELPEDDLPIIEILDILTNRNKKKIQAARAKEWQKIKIKTKNPIVLAFVGDPHLDDGGCDLELLRNHVELMSAPNVFAVNVGDTTNNWVGNLMRLYADQDTSLATARKLIKWFLNDSGVNWLFWVTGNHDLWGDGSEFIKMIGANKTLIEDWQAKVQLEFDTGLSVPVWVAHDFKGRSMYSKVHGAAKTARERRGAAIYCSGHTHDWGMYSEEHPDTGQIFHAMKARGYKFVDSYSIVNGFSENKHGATVAVVIDPREANLSTAITPFIDLEKAIKYCNSIT